MELMFQLPWLYYKGLGGVDSRAKAWAWMLWLDAQGPLPGGMGCRVIDEVTEMRHRFSLSDTAKSDMKKGEKLFKSMKNDYAVPRYPTLEEIIAEDTAVSAPCSVTDFHLDKWRQACSANKLAGTPRGEQQLGPQLILDIGAEGGGVTLWGSRKPRSRHWVFWCELDDWTPTLLDEPAIRRRSEVANSWDGVIALLDKYCRHWMKLSPSPVHPDFREKIWGLVERRHIVANLIGLNEEAL
jgi:hypothetical protein